MYSVAVMVRWRVSPRDSAETSYPMSTGRLCMVLKKAFGDFRVSYIKDEGQLCPTEDGGWVLVGMRPEAASALERKGGDTDKQFSYEWSRPTNSRTQGGSCGPIIWRRATPSSNASGVETSWRAPAGHSGS